MLGNIYILFFTVGTFWNHPAVLENILDVSIKKRCLLGCYVAAVIDVL